MTSLGILGPVQQAAGALVELLAARAAAEAAIALGRALGPLRHRLRPALYAPHSRPPSREGRPYSQASPRQPGAVARDLTEPLGLAQGELEDQPEHQHQLDRQIRVAGLAAWVVRRGACQPAIAASSSQSVRSPRRRRPASYCGQLRTRYCARGMR